MSMHYIKEVDELIYYFKPGLVEGFCVCNQRDFWAKTKNLSFYHYPH
jgi:hypothetical protein